MIISEFFLVRGRYNNSAFADLRNPVVILSIDVDGNDYCI